MGYEIPVPKRGDASSVSSSEHATGSQAHGPHATTLPRPSLRLKARVGPDPIQWMVWLKLIAVRLTNDYLTSNFLRYRLSLSDRALDARRRWEGNALVVDVTKCAGGENRR